VLWPLILFNLFDSFKLLVIMAPLTLPTNFQLKLYFSGQGQSNTNMASLSTSHAPSPTLSIVFEPSNPSVHEPLTRKPKRSYDNFHIFHYSWTAKFPWAKSILGEDSQVLLVKCMICLVIKGKDKFLSPKLDTL